MAHCDVKAIILKNVRFTNWDSEVRGKKWDYDEFLENEDYRTGWISFDSLLYDRENNLIYCGLATFDTDILYVYDRNLRKFISLGYSKIADKFDAKFHRSLQMDNDGNIYGAIALFHNLDRQYEAPGGSLVKYNPKTKEITKLAIPIPHAYIQCTAFDKERKIIYGFTFNPEKMFRYDLSTGETKDLGFIGNNFQICHPHIPAIDDEGNCWGTWGVTRAWDDNPGIDAIRLLKYNPEEDKITWFRHSLPKISSDDYGAVDSMLNGKDGYIYIGTTAGALIRLNPKTIKTELLGKPCPERRLSGLAIGPDGLLYGAGGDNGKARIFSYDRKKNKFYDLGPIFDRNLGENAVKIHDIVVTDDLVVYAGENDNHYRSSYLWECKVKI